MSFIRPYQGDLPAKCSYCFEENSNAKSLLQTICCTNSLATKVIPRTYHRDCLKKWAESRSEDFFNCFVCFQIIPKNDLNSKREILIQKITPYARMMVVTSVFSMISGTAGAYVSEDISIASMAIDSLVGIVTEK